MYSNRENVTLEDIRGMISSSNQYSLVSVILHQLLISAKEEDGVRRKMHQITGQIDSIYQSKGTDKEGFITALRMRKPFLQLWFMRDKLAKDFLSRHPGTSRGLRNLFVKLSFDLRRGDILTLSEQDLVPGYANSTCCRCITS